jgi:hypothetical protein
VASVFISYCRKNPRTRRVRDVVFAELAGHNVFVDESGIEIGEDWRARINDALATCRVAVVLIDDAALQSEWVQKEVSVLLWRSALGAELILLPVIVGRLTEKDSGAESFSELLRIQSCHVRSTSHSGIRNEIRDLHDAIRGLTAARRDVTNPMSEWISRIAFALADLSDSDLRASAEALGVTDELDALPRFADRVAFVAHQMLDYGLDGRVYRASARMDGRLPDYKMRNFIGEVLPTWVDIGAARHLLGAATDAKHPVLLLSATLGQSGQHYFERATCRTRVGYQCRPVSVLSGGSSVDDLLIELEAGVRAVARHPEEIPIEHLKPPEEHAYLVVNSGQIAMPNVVTAIRRIRDRFPWINIILLTGSRPLTEQSVREWFKNIPYAVLPKLALSDELRAYQLVTDMIRLLPQSLQGDLR